MSTRAANGWKLRGMSHKRSVLIRLLSGLPPHFPRRYWAALLGMSIIMIVVLLSTLFTSWKTEDVLLPSNHFQVKVFENIQRLRLNAQNLTIGSAKMKGELYAMSRSSRPGTVRKDNVETIQENCPQKDSPSQKDAKKQVWMR